MPPELQLLCRRMAAVCHERARVQSEQWAHCRQRQGTEHEEWDRALAELGERRAEILKQQRELILQTNKECGAGISASVG